jgi:phosphate-selective porin OprO and OprP
MNTMHKHSISRHGFHALSAATLFGGLAAVGQAGTTSYDKEPSGKNVPTEPVAGATTFDKIWGLATLYKSDTGFLNELSITGRYHGQFWNADSETGDDNDWDNRRFRIGARAYFLDRKFELKGEMFSDLNSGGDFYEGFTELYAAWHASEAFNLTVGKQKPKFGWEWSLSSRLIPTFERSALINQFRPDYAAGVVIDGKVDKWSYYTGVYSNDTVGDGDDTTEFGDFEGGWSYIGSIGYDFADALGVKKAQWRLDYIHSERDANDEIMTAFDNGISTSLELKQGDWGLLSELLFADGAGSNWGLVLIPTYDITKKLQVAGRYQLGISTDDTGLSAQRRYEREVGGGSGDLYNAFYLGLNYFIFDGKDVEKKPEQRHRLKLMAGVEYANMDGPTGYDGWTGLAGVRVYW